MPVVEIAQHWVDELTELQQASTLELPILQMCSPKLATL